MGIRIHKVMGYGLTDLQLDGDGLLDDSRLNPTALRQLGDKPLTDYQIFLRDKYADVTRHTSDLFYMKAFAKMAPTPPEQESAWNYIHVVDNSEWVDKDRNPQGIITIRPWAEFTWYRHDDAIDYMEDTLRSDREKTDSLATRVTRLDVNPHPYEGTWWDNQTGEKLNTDLVFLLRNVRDQESVDGQKLLTSVANELGYPDLATARTRVAPRVPQNVLDMIAWAGIFNAPETAWQLRPIIVSYWE